jgi:tricorn protease
MIEMLNRPLLNAIHERYSVVVFPVPTARIPGPKCLLINRVSSSSGENFAYYFRKSGLGKLIGTRTWGGLIGVNGNQSLIDGGYWWVPQSAFFVDQKRWMPEGIGIEPDITVMDDPALMRDGKDPQLDAAINYLLGELRKHPNTPIVHPEVRSRAARGAG